MSNYSGKLVCFFPFRWCAKIYLYVHKFGHIFWLADIFTSLFYEEKGCRNNLRCEMTFTLSAPYEPYFGIRVLARFTQWEQTPMKGHIKYRDTKIPAVSCKETFNLVWVKYRNHQVAHWFRSNLQTHWNFRAKVEEVSWYAKPSKNSLHLHHTGRRMPFAASDSSISMFVTESSSFPVRPIGYYKCWLTFHTGNSLGKMLCNSPYIWYMTKRQLHFKFWRLSLTATKDLNVCWVN